jgi:hypothetical protein
MLSLQGSASTLKATNRGDAHLSNEVRIFAEELFGSPVPRFTHQIDYGSKGYMRSAETRFARGDCKHLLHQIPIPRTRQSRWYRKNGSVLGEEAMGEFVVKKAGDAEPGFFHQEALNAINKRDGVLDIAKRL